MSCLSDEIKYCSTKCLHEHWDVHKPACERMQLAQKLAKEAAETPEMREQRLKAEQEAADKKYQEMFAEVMSKMDGFVYQGSQEEWEQMCEELDPECDVTELVR